MARTLLVVEDDNGVQTMVKMILEKGGYTVLQAKTLAEARETFKNHREEIGAIIMDRYLGSESTDSFISEIAVSPNPPPMVAFAATDESQGKQIALGCIHRISKPATSEKFIELFDSIIQK